jgi:hypothetical protein
MGNFTSGLSDPKIVVSTGLTTCVAVGVPGLWSAYLAESAERKRELLELSCRTLTDLNNTGIGTASRVAANTASLIDGPPPFLAALAVLTPS